MPNHSPLPPPPWSFKALEAVSVAFLRLVVRNKGDTGAQDCFRCTKKEMEDMAALVASFAPAAPVLPAALSYSGLGAADAGRDQTDPLADIAFDGGLLAGTGFSPAGIRPIIMQPGSILPLIDAIKKLVGKNDRSYRTSHLVPLLKAAESDIALAINQEGSGLTIAAGGWVRFTEGPTP